MNNIFAMKCGNRFQNLPLYSIRLNQIRMSSRDLLHNITNPLLRELLPNECFEKILTLAVLKKKPLLLAALVEFVEFALIEYGNGDNRLCWA